MRVNSRSDLPAISFKHWWTDDAEVGIVVMKATFGKLGSEPALMLHEQPPIRMQDVFHADPHGSSVVAESDLAPHKPRTDVTIAGIARAPEASASAEWPVRVAITGRADVSFQVTGPRMWEKRAGQWRLSPPRPQMELPIRYEHAYGGAGPDESGEMVTHPYNPVGQGFATAAMVAAADPIPAAQIGLMAELAGARPDRSIAVCGLGPTGRAWLPRRALAGTFDGAWRHRRHPRMPLDYSFAYWNAAPGALQVEPYLTGDETIVLAGLSHDPKPIVARLPGLDAFFRVIRSGGAASPAMAMALDTVELDVEDADPAGRGMTLVWRGWFRDPSDADEIETIVRRAGRDGGIEAP